MGVATILEAREIADSRHRRAQGRHRAPGGRGRDRPRGRRHLPAAAPEHDVLPRSAPRPPSSPGWRPPGWSARWSGPSAAAVRAVVWLSRQTGKAILKLTQRDYAEHRLSSLVAALRLARRAQRRRLQRARRQDPGPLEAAARQAHRLLLAASRRRRDLDGRHPPQAGRERQRHHRRVHDQRQPRRVRPRRAPPSRLSAAARPSSGGLANDAGAELWATGSNTFLARQAPGRRGHPGGAGHQADHPRVRGGGRAPDARAGGGSRAVPQPAVLPDRQGAEGSDRPRRRRDRARAARGGPARSRLRRRRPLRPARHPPDVQGGHRRRAGAGNPRRAAPPRSGSIAAPGRSGR